MSQKKKEKAFSRLLIAVGAFGTLSCTPDSEFILSNGNMGSFGFMVGVTDDAGSSPLQQSQVIDTFVVGDDTLELVCTVSDLDVPRPEEELATRGTPIYTRKGTNSLYNLQTVYGHFNASAFIVGDGGTLTDFKENDTDTDPSTAGSFINVDYAFDGYKDQGNESWEYWKAADNAADDFFWWQEYPLCFYAYAPTSNVTAYPFNLTKENFLEDGKIEFTYTVPVSSTSPRTDAEKQPDILVTSSGKAPLMRSGLGTGTINSDVFSLVPLTFYHALSGVRFKADEELAENQSGLTINSITLSGLKGTGTCTFDPAASGTTSRDKISWTYGTANDGTYTQTFSYEVPESSNFEDEATEKDATLYGAEEGEGASKNFMLIPQTYGPATGSDAPAATIAINYTYDGDAKTKSTSLGTANYTWYPGKLYTYAIRKISGNDNQLDLTVNGESLDGNEIAFEYGGGTTDILINSIIVDNDNNKLGDKPWEASLEFVGVGSEDPWVSLNPMSSTGGEEEITITAGPNIEVKEVAPEDVWVALKGATPSGTKDNRTDLSGGGETANCYLVHAPGYYKLPLVYGNARKADGSANTVAYNPGGDYPQFTDHDNNPITDPYIDNPYDCCLVWEDEPSLVRNVALSEDKQFLEFDVQARSIMEGNAVVAVRNAEGEIMWSWQIYVTNYTMGTGDGSITLATPQVPSAGKRNIVTYTFSGRPIGYCSPRTVEYKGGDDFAKCIVTITQEGGNQVQFTVFNKNKELYAGANETFYQWGRKDPMPGGYYEAAEGYYAEGANKPLFVDENSFTFTYLKNEQKTRGYSIQNPNVLINFPESQGLGAAADWEDRATTRYNSWNATSNLGTTAADIKNVNPTFNYVGAYTSVKSVYDPSPVGYKVPVHYPFLAFVPLTDSSNPTNPVPIDGEEVTSPVYGYWINATSPRVFFPRTGMRARRSQADNVGWGIFATCSSLKNELKAANFGLVFTGAFVHKGVANDMLGRFIATAVQPIREETVTAQTMAGQVLFEDNFGTKDFSSVSSYDRAGMTRNPYNLSLVINYEGGDNTSVSTTTTSNMTDGYLRYSSRERGESSSFVIRNVRTYGAQKVTLSFDAYISNTSYITTHTCSVGEASAQSFSSKSNNSYTFTIDGADPVDIKFTIKHNNSTNTGTVGIDNVKLTFNN